jgi:hypothetical protein
MALVLLLLQVPRVVVLLLAVISQFHLVLALAVATLQSLPRTRNHLVHYYWAQAVPQKHLAVQSSFVPVLAEMLVLSRLQEALPRSTALVCRSPEECPQSAMVALLAS